MKDSTRQIVFLVSTKQGWGKGKSLSDALAKYLEYNPQPKMGYHLAIWEIPNTDEAYEQCGFTSDGFHITYPADRKIIYAENEELLY